MRDPKLKEKWGTSLPYMISGATQNPQAEAMQLIKSKRYNLGDIISFLTKKEKKNIIIKKRLSFKKKSVLIIGGGDTVKKNYNYIRELLKKDLSIYIIFSSSRNADLFKNIKNQSILCITGNEINKINKKRLIKQKFLVNNIIDDKTILPKYLKNFHKLKTNSLDKKINNAPLAIALSAAKEVNAKNVFLIGFDGYEKLDKINDYSLYNENQKIFNFYKKKLNLISLSDTTYENVKKSSIYKYIN